MWFEYFHDLGDIVGVERAFGLRNVLYLNYESLKDKSKRVMELERVSNFLNMSVSKERLNCAFVLAKSEQVKISYFNIQFLNAKDLTFFAYYTIGSPSTESHGHD